ncbi:MAG: diamine N-acetyltransferase [Cellvibrionaceae bacterium]|jgi:diamine N-acetyltransferase
MVELRPINAHNWEEAVKLKMSSAQERFVPSVAMSLAKAYIQPDGMTYDPVGIYSTVIDEIVGFYSYMYRPHNMRVVYIGGFLIDGRFQRQGYGVAAMKLFLQNIQSELPECEGVYLTVHPENLSAERFYSQFGFTKTGLVIGGEDAMGLTFQNNKMEQN